MYCIQREAISKALEALDQFRRQRGSPKKESTSNNEEDRNKKPPIPETSVLASNLQEVSRSQQSAARKMFPSSKFTEGEKEEEIAELVNRESPEGGTGFCAAVSLNDGMVMYVTESIRQNNILGYPNDLWVGRSFINFVHPKDRSTFSKEITAAITAPLGDPNHKATHEGKRRSVFVRIRKFFALADGKFSVRDRKTVYIPFKLSICFKDVE